ncbi:MAG: hypothetical protein ABIA04_02500 [Pseudomonadota bacterium]
MSKQIKTRSIFLFFSVTLQIMILLIGCTASNNKDETSMNNSTLSDGLGIDSLSGENLVNIGISAKLSMAAESDPSELGVSVSIVDNDSTETADLAYVDNGVFSASALSVTKGAITATLTIDAAGIFGGPYTSVREVEVTEDTTIDFEMYIGTTGDECSDVVVAEVFANYADSAANEKTLSVIIQNVQTAEALNPADYDVTMTYAVGEAAASSVTPTIDGNSIEHVFEITENDETAYTHSIAIENECSSVSFTTSENYSKEATVTVNGEITVFSIDMDITSSVSEGIASYVVEIGAEDSEGSSISVMDDFSVARFDYLLTQSLDNSLVLTSLSSEPITLTDAITAGDVTLSHFRQSSDADTPNLYSIEYELSDNVESFTLVLTASATPVEGSSDLAATVNENHSIVIESSESITFSVSFTDSADEVIEEGEVITLVKSDTSDSTLGSCEVSSSICEISADLNEVVDCMADSSCSLKFYYTFDSVDYSKALYNLLKNDDNTAITGLVTGDSRVAVASYLENDAENEVEGLIGSFSTLILNPEITFNFGFTKTGTALGYSQDVSLVAYNSLSRITSTIGAYKTDMSSEKEVTFNIQEDLSSNFLVTSNFTLYFVYNNGSQNFCSSGFARLLGVSTKTAALEYMYTNQNNETPIEIDVSLLTSNCPSGL